MHRLSQLFVGCALIACLWGCAGPAKPRPAELLPVASLMAVKQVWTSSIGEVGFALDVKVVGGDVYLASSAGTLSAIDAQSGTTRWSVNLGARIAAGVGADGEKTSVVTSDGELITLLKGKKLWQQRLGAVPITAPLIAGGRVFVVTPDRTLMAFDGDTGQRLWQQQRGASSLVLDQPGVLLPLGDTLVAGIGGRLVGFNPLNGAQRWDIPVAVTRGTNEVERLVDVVAGVSRSGANLCVRAYLNAVACVDVATQKIMWSKVASGFSGIGGDEQSVFGTEADGRLVAWRRVDGERVWQSDVMRWRDLGTPLVLGESLAVPDSAGFLHLMSKTDGAPLGRLTLDGTSLSAPPVLVGKTLVVVTRKGSVYAFRPE